jgi:hypothetical protein
MSSGVSKRGYRTQLRIKGGRWSHAYLGKSNRRVFRECLIHRRQIGIARLANAPNHAIAAQRGGRHMLFGITFILAVDTNRRTSVFHEASGNIGSSHILAPPTGMARISNPQTLSTPESHRNSLKPPSTLAIYISETWHSYPHPLATIDIEPNPTHSNRTTHKQRHAVANSFESNTLPVSRLKGILCGKFGVL